MLARLDNDRNEEYRSPIADFRWKVSRCKDIGVTVFDIHERIVRRPVRHFISDGYRLVHLDLAEGDLAILHRR